MDKLANQIVDVTDDPAVEFDKEAGGFPDYVAGASRLSSDALSTVKDSNFAAIIKQRGGVAHRKWPLVDKAHVYMAAYYWGQTDGILPDVVRRVAAHFILEAAYLWGISNEVPNRAAMDRERARLAQVPRSNIIDLAALGVRMSEMTRKTPDSGRHLHYTATGDDSPLGKQASEEVVYALPSESRFPIHSKALLKRAMEYFESKELDIPFRARFEMGAAIEKQASVLNVPMRPCVRKYASCGYRDDAPTFIRSRLDFETREGWPEGGREAIEKIAESAASKRHDPETLMHALANFDKMAGLDRHYGRVVRDPARIFAAGPKGIEKAASFVAWIDGHAFTQDDIAAALEKRAELEEVLGKTTTEKLAEEGKGGWVFRELPSVQKRYVAKLAGFDPRVAPESEFAAGLFS